MIRQAVILVGGRGDRLNDRVRFVPAVEVPKPLIEVGGKPFVTYAINMLKGVDIKDIILLVLYKRELFEPLVDSVVRLSTSSEDVNKAVLEIPNLDNAFILLNGDCFPVMGREDWMYLRRAVKPVIPVKVVDRDAGIAVVTKAAIAASSIDCSKIGDMRGKYEEYTILGGLHIGTYQGLERARLFMDTIVFGQ